MSEHRLEVADVFRTYGDHFLALWERVLSRPQRKAFDDIRNCRTAALGAMCSITIADIAPSLTTRVLWGVIPYGELNAVTGAKATTRSPFFSPLRTWDCQRRAAPVGRIYPDRMPQMIRSRLVVKVSP